MKKRTFVKGSALLLTSLTWLSTALADEFPPSKPVTLVVGFAAGGAADAAARTIAKVLAANIGQSVVVENRGGAGGNIAHTQVANGPTDGSMILLGSVGPLAISPHLMQLNYDPLTSLAPISGGVHFPTVLVVHKAAGINNLKEYVEKAKAAPNSIDFASTGAGSASHLAGELLKQRANIQTVHVPYKGGGPAMQDVLGERVTGYFAAPPTALPQIEAGRLIPIATTGLTRPDYMPNIPTVAESGYPGFEALNWYAFVAPGKTSPAILDRWNTEIVKALNTPEVVKMLTEHGLTPNPTTRDELAAFIKKEYDQWGKVIQEGNLKNSN
jgi:tripartite-type tricarboxylate transporter receptor subunit TctC